MTAQEAAALIVTRWRLEHTVEAIMMALLMQRVSVTRYCDSCTENTTYRAKRAE